MKLETQQEQKPRFMHQRSISRCR